MPYTSIRPAHRSFSIYGQLKKFRDHKNLRGLSIPHINWDYTRSQQKMDIFITIVAMPQACWCMCIYMLLSVTPHIHVLTL